MLPFEAHLLAAGWPRWEDAPSNGEEGGEEGGGSGGGGGRVLAREGSRAARLLFMARRCGWWSCWVALLPHQDQDVCPACPSRACSAPYLPRAV